MPKLETPDDAAPKAERPAPPTGAGVAQRQADSAAIEPIFTELADMTDKVNGLWYGKSGSGKTTDLCTLANYGRIVFVNAEGGLKRKPLVNRGIAIDNIQVTTLSDYPAGRRYDALEALFWHLTENVPYGVVWDSITEIHRILMREQIDRRVAKARVTGRGSDDPFFTDLADYNPVTEQLRILLRRFRDLDCHFGISALERRDVDQDTSKVSYGPAISPAIQTDLQGMVDVVIHTEVGGSPEAPEYRGVVIPAGKYEAKDRLDSLPNTMAFPSFERVIDYVEGDLTEETDPLRYVSPEEAVSPAA